MQVLREEGSMMHIVEEYGEDNKKHVKVSVGIFLSCFNIALIASTLRYILWLMGV